MAGLRRGQRARRGPPQHRPGLPGHHAGQLPDRRAEPALPRRALRRAAGRGGAADAAGPGHGRAVGPPRQPGRDVLRRHEAAAGDRPRPAARAARAVPGRAHGRPRPADPRVASGTTSTSCKQREDITIFLTTHYMDEAEHCDRIAIIDHGKIVAHRHAGGAQGQCRQGPGADPDRGRPGRHRGAGATASASRPRSTRARSRSRSRPGEQFVPRLFAELGARDPVGQRVPALPRRRVHVLHRDDHPGRRGVRHRCTCARWPRIRGGGERWRPRPQPAEVGPPTLARGRPGSGSPCPSAACATTCVRSVSSGAGS